ncbi:MAG: M28 family metallopeptidase [Gammaproteobacteria bacterium]
MSRASLLAALAVFSLAACNSTNQPAGVSLDTVTPKAMAHAGPTLDEKAFRRHVKALSSDEFEGRSPSSAGEAKTLAYLAEAFQRIGLKPGNGKSFFQDVPLVTMTASAQPIQIKKDGVVLQSMAIGPDAVTWSKHVTEAVALSNSEMVFVGYGIVAPEYDWNDYEGIDMTGKTAVILVNDPGFATQDPELFRGNAMTYYGRWTYKFEEAARQGAAGAIIVHETEPAAYPWAVVEGSWTGPQHDLVAPDKNFSRASIEGWMTFEQAAQVFANGGADYQRAKASATSRDFKPLPLGLTASTSLTNEISIANSKNVLGLLEGSERPDEIVIFTAHWDHLGKDPNLEGDQIYNGAVDNATGTAALIVLADAFLKADTKPKRSLLFLAVTAEESGLLGSKHYGENPVYPLAKTIGGVNIDAMNVYGRTRDVAVVGHGSSQMEDILAAAAAKQGRIIVPEPSPEKGYFYRSDHFNLAKKGVPMLYAEGGNDQRIGGRAAGDAVARDYVSNRYHKPADEYSEDWDLSGTMEDLALYYSVAEDVANRDGMVEWYDGTEFKAIRQKSLAGD